MRYTRISTYEMTNGTFDELTGVVEKGILPTFANLPGFENFGRFGQANPRDALTCAYEEVTTS